jgi:hypothetical protein
MKCEKSLEGLSPQQHHIIREHNPFLLLSHQSLYIDGVRKKTVPHILQGSKGCEEVS